MEYRGVQYKISKGVERNVWKWSVSFEDGLTKSGQAESRRRAINVVWRLIDDVLASKKTDGGAVEKLHTRRIPAPHQIEALQRELAAFNERIAELKNQGHQGHAMEVLKATRNESTVI